MSDVVLDSCVVTKWFLAESDSDQAEALFNALISGGGKIFVLDIVFTEVANALWKRQRRKLIKAGEETTLLEDLMQLPLTVVESANLLPLAMEIAVKYDRSVYDSLFVALVHKSGLPGITTDERLYNATHHDFPQIMLLQDWSG